MNNFLFEELLIEEYHREKMAEAEEYNRYAYLSEKKVALFTYKALSNLGAALKNAGTKMQARYENLALREERNTLPNLVK
jgi:hypothetical protein